MPFFWYAKETQIPKGAGQIFNAYPQSLKEIPPTTRLCVKMLPAPLVPRGRRRISPKLKICLAPNSKLDVFLPLYFHTKRSEPTTDLCHFVLLLIKIR